MTVTDHNGLVWANHGPHTDDHLAFGAHEPALLQVARSLLPEGGTFLDVGAHVGLYSLNLADKAGHVYSIEANPKTYSTLLENIAANQDRLNAEIHAQNIAAWDRFEELRLIDHNDKESGGSTRCDTEPGPAEALKILPWTAQGMPLDHALPAEARIDFVKIDVEGAEARVLRGMSKRLVNDRPILLIEMHDMYFGRYVRIDTLAILEALGYQWNDDLCFGGSYYVLARADSDPDEFVIETVRAGQ